MHYGDQSGNMLSLGWIKKKNCNTEINVSELETYIFPEYIRFPWIYRVRVNEGL